MKNPFANYDSNSGSSSNILTAKMYFGQDGGKLLASPASFLEWGTALTTYEAKCARVAIDCMFKRMAIDGNPYVSDNPNIKPYEWRVFRRGRATYECKIVVGGGLAELITIYEEGKININFTLDDLITVAKEATAV